MTSRRSRATGGWILLGVVLGTVVVALVIVLTYPRAEPEPVVALDDRASASVEVRIRIEEVNAAQGSMKVSLAAEPGDEDLPPEGVSVYVDVDDVPPLRITRDDLLTRDVEAVIPFDRGSVNGYPFDRYSGTLLIQALRGQPTTLDEVVAADPVALGVTLIDSSDGFDAHGSVAALAEGDTTVELSYGLDRRFPSVLWASVMMGIYWLLAGAVVAVFLAVVLGARAWETRHLAWFAAMIFALASFRAAAPGSPPIGVYFDYASFFWAELLVALALAGLVAYYLVAVHDDAAAA